jgi:hypothetical protein
VGPGCQRLREKEKGEGKGGPAREVGWWAAWLPGLKGASAVYLFFFLFFSNFIFKSCFNSNSIQTFFKLFSRIL